MYRECWIDVDQALVLLIVVQAIIILGCVVAIGRQTAAARRFRELFKEAAANARQFKRERDHARTELLFPDRKKLSAR